jgi:1-acyl-sn-glycerol-3-phosphate acyltransferase
MRIFRYIFKPLYRIKVFGLENVPDKGAYIICANHRNAIDPILIGSIYPHKVYCMAKAELFDNKFLAWFFGKIGTFPVKRGEPDMKSIKTSLKILSEGKILGLFPEGTRNKSDDIKAEPGIAMFAIKSKVPIVPVAIISDYKMFKKTKIVIGAPIDLAKYYDTKLQNEDYYSISYDIMIKINQIIKGEIYEINSGQ